MRKEFGNVLSKIKGKFQKSNILTRCFSSIFKLTIATALFLMLIVNVMGAMPTSFGLQGKITAANGEIIPRKDAKNKNKKVSDIIQKGV